MPKAPDPDTVVLLSGGLGSVVAAHTLQRQGMAVTALAVDYGQRHRRELRYAADLAQDLGVHLHVTKLQLPYRCAMTTPGVPLPEGVGTSSDNTNVPGRMGLLVSLAAGYAVAHGCGMVAYGASYDTAKDYPDTDGTWFMAMERALWAGYGLALSAPVLHRSTGGLVATAREWGIPLGGTYSCLQGGREPCGRCVKCVQRQHAGA